MTRADRIDAAWFGTVLVVGLPALMFLTYGIFG